MSSEVHACPSVSVGATSQRDTDMKPSTTGEKRLCVFMEEVTHISMNIQAGILLKFHKKENKTALLRVVAD